MPFCLLSDPRRNIHLVFSVMFYYDPLFDNNLISRFKFIAFEKLLGQDNHSLIFLLCLSLKFIRLYDVQSKHTSFYNCFVLL